MSVNFYDSTTGTLTRLDGLASEANIVHKSGTETVTGEKTFSGDVVATRIESTGTVTIGKRYNESESAPTGGNLAVEGDVTFNGTITQGGLLTVGRGTILAPGATLNFTPKFWAPYLVFVSETNSSEGLYKIGNGFKTLLAGTGVSDVTITHNTYLITITNNMSWNIPVYIWAL